MTKDDRVAAAGSLVVLCCGSLRYAPFITRFVPNGRAQYFPFLRGYLPSFAFPFFILFVIVVWMIIKTNGRRKKFFLSVAAAAIFTLLLFSYFYLWTAVIAWVCLLAILWMVFRPDGYRKNLKDIAVIGGVAIVGLLGYWQLLSHRAAATDAFQVVTTTHRPDLLRVPELIGVVVAAAIVVCAKRAVLSLREPRMLFVLSLSLLPFVVFNQQVLTGYSIQPIHYELYVANYVALLAMVLAFGVMVQVSRLLRFPSRALTVAAICAIGWGVVEVTYAIRARAQLNRIRDEVRPAALRLRDIAATSPVTVDQRSAVVLVTNIVQADTLPADAPQPVLWAPHMRSFPGVSLAEEKSRYYAQLYYTGTDVKSFESLLRQTTIAPSVVFGWERVNPRLTADAQQPITEAEIKQEVASYSEYVNSFSHERAASLPLTFVVASPTDELQNVDRWYVRREAVAVGNLMQYRVMLR